MEFNYSQNSAQHYSQGINQQKGVEFIRYSDWLPRYPHPKLELLSMHEVLCK